MTGFMWQNMNLGQAKETYTQMNSGTYVQATGSSGKAGVTKSEYEANFSDISDGEESDNCANTDVKGKTALKKGIGDTLQVDPNKVSNANQNDPPAAKEHVDSFEVKSKEPETAIPSSSTGKKKTNVNEEPKVSNPPETVLNKDIPDGNDLEQAGIKKKPWSSKKKNPK